MSAAIQNNSIWDRLRKIGLVCLGLLVFDLATTGAGRYISVGWFSPRIVMALMTAACALPLFIRNLRRHLKEPMLWLVLAFAAYAAVQAVRGLIVQNPRGVWKSDIMGFAWLALFPLMLELIPDRKTLRRIVNWALAGAAFQAAVCLGFMVYFTAFGRESLRDFLEYYVWEWQWGTLFASEFNVTRVFCRSSMYLIAAVMVLLGRVMEEKRFPFGKAALFLLCFEAVFYTYTRSLYFALVVGLVLGFVFLLVTQPAKRVILRTLILAACFLGITFASDLILKQGSFQYAFARCFGIDLSERFGLPKTWDDSADVDMENITGESDVTRDFTLDSLNERIAASPVIGHGMGATSVRGTNDEYFYHDMLMRYGIIGLALYFAPAGYALYLLFRNRKRLKTQPEPAMLFVGLCSFMVATYYNPWLNAAIGISWYSLTASGAVVLKGDNP